MNTINIHRTASRRTVSLLLQVISRLVIKGEKSLFVNVNGPRRVNAKALACGIVVGKSDNGIVVGFGKPGLYSNKGYSFKQ